MGKRKRRKNKKYFVENNQTFYVYVATNEQIQAIADQVFGFNKIEKNTISQSEDN